MKKHKEVYTHFYVANKFKDRRYRYLSGFINTIFSSPFYFDEFNLINKVFTMYSFDILTLFDDLYCTYPLSIASIYDNLYNNQTSIKTASQTLKELIVSLCDNLNIESF